MARSVDYLSYATEVNVFNYPCYNCEVYDEENDEYKEGENWEFEEWELVKNEIINALTSVSPSLYECDRYDGETCIILENGLCEIGISDYCGLSSISIRHKEMDTCNTYGIYTRYVNNVWGKMLIELSKYVGTIGKRVATFSNGEAIYKPIEL